MKTTSIIRIILFFIAILIFLALYLIFENNYDKILQILDSDIESILKHQLLMIFMIFFLIFSLFNIFFLPGKTIFITVSAYIIKNFVCTFILIFLCEVLWNFISFLLFSNIRKYSKFILKLVDKKIYNIFKNKFKNNPWKISLIIQTISIPQTFKDVILISFDIKFYLYFLSRIIVSLIYIPLVIIFGLSLNSLSELKNNNEDKNKSKLFLITGSIGFFTIFIFIFIFCLINKEYNKIINEEKDLKIALNTEDIEKNCEKNKENKISSEIETEDSENFENVNNTVENKESFNLHIVK